MLYVTHGEYGYLETIQAFFLEVTGKGLVLSSRDIEALLAWQADGASAATVCKGIERAIEARAERPRDIWSCRKWIEPLVETTRQRVTSATPAPQNSLSERLLAQIEEAGRTTEREAFKAAYRTAWTRVRAQQDALDWEALLELDTALSMAFLEALTHDEQMELDAVVGRDSSLAAMSQEAQQLHRTARTRKLLRERFGLLSLLDV